MSSREETEVEAEARAALDGFIDRYTPEVAGRMRACLARLRARLPGACELVYDNYNALAVGFGPGERAPDAIISLAAYPRWVTLFFLYGKGLPDPEGRLQGEGARVRSMRIDRVEQLDTPAISDLIAAALDRAGVTLDDPANRRLVIKAVAAKQRPRRP